jgi:LEA14-like dessication related protein
LGGCSPLFQKPTVNCSSVTIAGVGSEGVDLKVTLEVDNRNRFPILVQGYSYSLTVMDTPFSTGSEMRELSLAPRTTTEVVLPLQVPLASILEILAKRPDPDRVTYELEAVLDIRTSFAARRLPVTSSGQFSIPSKYRPDHYLRQLRRLLPNVQG